MSSVAGSDKKKKTEYPGWMDIAILLDVLSVYIGSLGEASGAFTTYVFAFNVPLFFFLMGCRCKYSETDKLSWHYIVKQIRTLLLPMWILTAVVTGLHYFLLAAPKESIPMLLLVMAKGDIRNEPISGASWLISCLFVMDLLFRLLLLLKKRWAVLLSSVVLYAMTLLLFPAAPRVAPTWIYNADSAIHYVLFYTAGYFLVPYITILFAMDRPKKKTAVIISFCGACVVSAIFFLYPKEVYGIFSGVDLFWELGCFLLIPAILSWVLLCLARFADRWKLPAKAGKEYVLLLCNEQVFAVLVAALYVSGIVLPLHGVVYAAIRIVLACLVFIPVEKQIARAVKFLIFGTAGYTPISERSVYAGQDRIVLAVVSCIFIGLVWFLHMPMQIISDDAINVEYMKEVGGLFENIYYRYMSNGKCLTDGLAATVSYMIPFTLWKVLDTMLYGVLLYLIWDLFTDRSARMMIVCGVAVLLFPFSTYLSSAGFIATTTNYVYTFLGILFGAAPLIKMCRGRKAGIFSYLFAFAGLVYAENQDQTAAIAIGLFLMFGGYYLVRWLRGQKEEDKRLVSQSFRFLVIAVLIYLWMFYMPGHIFRMTNDWEMDNYLPQFRDWTLSYKLYRGMATTFANLFFLQPTVYVIFCLLLIAHIFLYNRKQLWCGILLSVLALAANVLDKRWFITYPLYGAGMPDLTDGAGSVLFSVALFLSLILAVYAVGRVNERLALVLFTINVLGFGSRIMMGMSPTLYISSFRTFTAQLFSFILCDVLLMQDILKSLKGRETV